MKFYYYKILNIKNGNFYIGITTDYQKRWKEHLRNLRNHTHPNYKIQKDFDIFGEDSFSFSIIDEKDTTKEKGYEYEYKLIQENNATSSYNICEGGLINPVYSPQVVKKLKETHQQKYDDILQYSFDGKQFHLKQEYKGIRDACRETDCDLRGIQNAIKKAQAHHGFYWVKASQKDEWLQTFLKRHRCCVAKLNEESLQIEDSALTIREFAEKYQTTYDKIYRSLCQNNRCERKYKFIRISAEDFAKLNHLSL